MSGLLGKKIGMSRVPLENGTVVPVTLVSVGPNVITQIKTQDKDGYNAIAVGMRRDSKSEQVAGNLKRTFQCIREFRVADPSQYKRDQELSVALLDGITTVSVRGVSKGKGFAGVVKRHHFKGGPRTHGAKYQRAPGSIGTRKPRRTKPGHRLPGHMGVDQVTLHGVPVVRIDTEHNIVALKGPLPGSINSIITLWIRDAGPTA